MKTKKVCPIRSGYKVTRYCVPTTCMWARGTESGEWFCSSSADRSKDMVNFVSGDPEDLNYEFEKSAKELEDGEL